MQIGLLIFSRIDSKRLPRKAFKYIGERTLIGRVLDRARLVKGNYKIVLVTSDRVVDDPLIEFAKEEKIKYFRGSLNNIILRAVNCCEHFGFSAFARICGDRPFHCPKILEKLISIYKKKNYDLVTNCMVKTFPRGLSAEVISLKTLKEISNMTKDPFDLEHITNYPYLNSKRFKIFNLKCKLENLKKYNLSVDTYYDLMRAKWIVSNLDSNSSSETIEKIFSLMKLWRIKRL